MADRYHIGAAATLRCTRASAATRHCTRVVVGADAADNAYTVGVGVVVVVVVVVGVVVVVVIALTTGL